MKMYPIILAMGLAVAFSSSAQQKPVADGNTLGRADAILNFCGKINPQGQQKYSEVRKTMTAGLSEEAIHELEQSPEYREAYDSAHAALNDVPQDSAAQTCANAVQSL